MRVSSALAGFVAAGAGLVTGVVSYQSSAEVPEVPEEHTSAVIAVGRPLPDAPPRIRTQLADCVAPAVLEGGVCVTRVVETVPAPAPAPAAVPAAQAAPARVAPAAPPAPAVAAPPLQAHCVDEDDDSSGHGSGDDDDSGHGGDDCQDDDSHESDDEPDEPDDDSDDEPDDDSDDEPDDH